MEVKRCVKEAFTVIGKQGSTEDGAGFIDRLWRNANSHFDEIAALAKRDDAGNLAGLWGAMSDFSLSFQPWEAGFTKGLYLAGVEAADGAEAQKGWAKWVLPASEYLYVKVENGVPATFSAMIQHMAENGFTLAGAVYDFSCPKENGQGYMFFPIRRV